MLPYGTGILLAFMHVYCIFNLLLFLSILFYNFFNLVLKRQTKMVNSTSIFILLTLLPFFTRAIPKGLTFGGICLYVLRLCNVHVLYCMCCAIFELVKSPEVTLCG